MLGTGPVYAALGNHDTYTEYVEPFLAVPIFFHDD